MHKMSTAKFRTAPSYYVKTMHADVSNRDVDLGSAVCPPAEELRIGGVVTCPLEGCNQQLQSSSHLQMHLARRHGGKPLEKAKPKGQVAFYCPEEKCERSQGKGKPFPRMGQLKQHYQTVHGSKDFVCQRCKKRFALRDVCSRHETECGQLFKCGSCGDDFRSRNALYQHAKRKKHSLPEGSQPRKTKERKLDPSSVIGRPGAKLLLLPRQSCASTQTDSVQRGKAQVQDTAVQTDTSGEEPALGYPNLVSSGLVSEFTSQSVQVDFQAPTSVDLNDLAIQTDFQVPASMNFNHLATQTDFCLPTTVDLTTQTDFHHTSIDFNDLAVQTDLPTSIDFNDLATQTDLPTSIDFNDLAVQTDLPTSIDFNDLATQTDFHLPTSVDLTTQTDFHLPTTVDLNELATQTDFLAAQLLSFGTQTTMATATHSSQTHPPALSCELGTQTYEFLNVDFGTQTGDTPPPNRECNLDFIDPPLCLPPECMEFGTQTLESALGDISCLDFGVQTQLFQNETKDQGSQT